MNKQLIKRLVTAIYFNFRSNWKNCTSTFSSNKNLKCQKNLNVLLKLQFVLICS